MIQCPNCGGALKFDITAQQMKCESCSSLFKPYDFEYGNSAEEETEYDVTIYKCPNCGGEITSTDETAAGFCSYCGSSTVLQGRLSREKRPELIIPFKKTKKECESAFERFVKKAIFAPKSFRQAGRSEAFRGIYMPYWLYDMSQRGPISIPTSTSHRSGDYIITDHYRCTGNLDNYYNGVSYDASSSFADDISSEIAPFNVKDITKFSPSFLAGYYADIADVDSTTYNEAAIELAKECTYNYLNKKSPMSGNSFDESKETIKKKIGTNINVTRSAMFPVWFMAYRNKDRIAYATVNGQTGKVSADIPMSIPKFFVCALGIAAIVFCLLQMFFTAIPATLAVIVSILGLISVIIYNSQIKKIVAKENYDDDLGMIDVMQKKKQSRLQAQKGATLDGEAGAYVLTENDIKRSKREYAKRKKSQKKATGLGTALIVGVVLAFIFGPMVLGMATSIMEAIGLNGFGGVINLVIAIIALIITINTNKHVKEMVTKKAFAASIFTTISLFLITIISFIDPHSDIIYYAVVLAAMVGVIINLLDLIKCFNLIAMRPLPQFERYKGGDDRRA